MAFEDPDYDDFEFREIHPEIYGDDTTELSRKRAVRKKPMEWTKKDEQFHQEYLAWKRKHPNRVEEIKAKPQKPKNASDNPGSDEPSYILYIFLALLIYPPIIIMLIQSCNE